jgi:hypothetical protein
MTATVDSRRWWALIVLAFAQFITIMYRPSPRGATRVCGARWRTRGLGCTPIPG